MKYFTIKELTYSDTASRLGINNSPNSTQQANLIKLVDAVLDPLRELYGKPIHISSGFRCTQLNKAVGGASSSQHLCLNRSAAVDIVALNKDKTVNHLETKKLYDLIVKHLPFDQIILEKGTITKPNWVHVSYDETKNRRQKLYYNGKSYIAI